MIDAGAVFKLRQANIDVGSSSVGLDRSLGALQVLGTPTLNVYFTSFHDQTIGERHGPSDFNALGGDWGGLVFRNDVDYDEEHVVLETEGIFLNYVNHAEIRYGGGQVTVNSVRSVYNPIHMVEARPTVSFNTVVDSASAAMSADPNSFADTKYQDEEFTAGYDRVGPDIHGNLLVDNSINGLFVRIRTEAGKPVDELSVVGRFNDLDIVHVISENLFISGTPGGPTLGANGLDARLDARLTIDPGIFVKLDHSRIEVEVSAQLIAEGRPGYPVIFTSLFDDRYGAGGTFDTTGDGDNYAPAAGDWGGIYFHPASTGSIDNALDRPRRRQHADRGRFCPVQSHRDPPGRRASDQQHPGGQHRRDRRRSQRPGHGRRRDDLHSRRAADHRREHHSRQHVAGDLDRRQLALGHERHRLAASAGASPRRSRTIPTITAP